ncbi:nucleoside hydrolase-like domain-containing protein [Zobellia nedashkovskayae]
MPFLTKMIVASGIRDNFRDLFYIVTPGDDYDRATWNGINSVVSGIDNTEISNSWLAENIQQAHGALGAAYPDVAYGMEGDTPAFLSLIPNGLNSSEHPNWGGWGGRYEFYKPYFSGRKQGKSGVPFEVETRKIWTNAEDSFTPFVTNEYGRTITSDTLNFTSDKVSLWRWRDDFQNDFAARMDWCTLPYEEANHAPIIVLNHPENITIESGKSITFDAANSTDSGRR